MTEDDPGLKDDGVDETTGVDSDFFHRQYDSPIKQKPVQHIQEQDAEIEYLNKCLKPGLTHHFSNFDAKMMPTKPNTLEHRRHGDALCSQAHLYALTPNHPYSPHPQKPLHIWVMSSMKTDDAGQAQ